MKATYDREADALYVYVHPERGPNARTVPATDDVMVDQSADGQLVGVEVLDAAAQPDLAGTLAQFHITFRDIEMTFIGVETPGLPKLR
jgi:uncharacterized protein YuzE